MDWYLEKLDQGSFDHVTYPSDHLAGCGDLLLLGGNVAECSKTSNHDGHDDACAGAIVLSPAAQNAVVYLQSLLDAEASSVPSRHILIPILAPSTTPVDSTDLNDTKVMLSDPTATVTGFVVASTSDAEGDEDDEQKQEDDTEYVEPEDIIRHYWYRGDIKYTFIFGGHQYYMTAKQMIKRFGGVKYSIWHYWKAKRTGRIPYARLTEYLRRNGHHGFFREMVWHLLPRWLQTLLYAARKDGTIETLVIPDYKPKGNGKKRK